MKLLTTNRSHPLGFLDHFFDLGMTGVDTARSFLKPLHQVGAESYENSNHLRLGEDDQNFYARLDAPGFKKKDVEIEIKDGELSIRASRKEKFGDEHAYHLERTLRLGDQIDTGKVEATLEDGILKITLPKAEKAKACLVSVN